MPVKLNRTVPEMYGYVLKRPLMMNLFEKVNFLTEQVKLYEKILLENWAKEEYDYSIQYDDTDTDLHVVFSVTGSTCNNVFIEGRLGKLSPVEFIYRIIDDPVFDYIDCAVFSPYQKYKLLSKRLNGRRIIINGRDSVVIFRKDLLNGRN